METIEEWRDILGYEKLYRVSSLGIVYSLQSDKTLKQGTFRLGYRFVNLYNPTGKTRKTLSTHRLVAAAFLGPSELTVNHKNGIKADNRLANLEYATRQEQTLHAYANGLKLPMIGESNGSAKLTECEVIEIRRLSELGHTRRALARQFNVDRRNIALIATRQAWRHVA